jgi:hypothetical protein
MKALRSSGRWRDEAVREKSQSKLSNTRSMNQLGSSRMPQDSIHRLNREEGTEPLRDRDRITEAIAAYMKEQERKKTSWILESPNEL